MFAPRLCLLILQYNQAWLTEQLLHSLYAFEPVDQYHIVVVDNASTEPDGFAQMAHQFPQVEWVKNTTNLGYAKAMNKEARRLSAQFTHLLLLNNDVVLRYNTVERCFAEALRLNAQAVSCTMLSKLNLPVTNFSVHPAPWYFLLYNATGLTSLWRQRMMRRKRATRVYFLNSAFLLLECDTFAKAQFFCEDFFMYSEDLDLMFRLNKLNARMYFLPQESFVHMESASCETVWEAQERASLMVQQDIQVYRRHHHRHWVRLYVWARFLQQRAKHLLLGDEIAALYVEALRPFVRWKPAQPAF